MADEQPRDDAGKFAPQAGEAEPEKTWKQKLAELEEDEARQAYEAKVAERERRAREPLQTPLEGLDGARGGRAGPSAGRPLESGLGPAEALDPARQMELLRQSRQGSLRYR